MRILKVFSIILLGIVLMHSCGKDIDETTTSRSITIRGTVINSSRGPVDDAEVTMFINGEETEETQTNSDGGFEFFIDEATIAQSIIVKVQKEQYAKAYKEVSDHDDNISLLNFTLNKSENISECNGNPFDPNTILSSGRIIDENGNPSKGTVTFSHQDDEDIISYTNADGVFEAFVVKGNFYQVTFSTNCFSKKLDVFSTKEEALSNIGPVENYRFLDERPIFEDNADWGDYIVKAPLEQFTISGQALDCSGNPIQRGRVIFEIFWEIPIINGSIALTTFDCFEPEDNYTYVVEDYENDMHSDILVADRSNNTLELGTVSACTMSMTSATLEINKTSASETFLSNHDFKDCYVSPNPIQWLEDQGEVRRAPKVILVNDDIEIEIESLAIGVGSYQSSIVEIIGATANRYISSNNNELNLHFTSFDYDTFYGLSSGTISGTYKDYQDTYLMTVDGEFTVVSIPNFGEY